MINPRLLRPLALLLSCATLAIPAGCSHHSSGAPVGVGIGVRLSTTNTTGTLLNLGQNLTMTATVLNDPNNLGVTWSVLPVPASPPAIYGGLSSLTKTTVVYTAPAYTSYTDAQHNTKAGQAAISLTATSIADRTKFTTTTIIANGLPTFPTNTNFLPGNQNVPYGAAISVIGGTAPYTWLLQGTLPAGLNLSTSTGTAISITGTPTTISASPPPTFAIKVTDANNNSATAAGLFIKVHAQTGCIIDGAFAFGISGYAFAVPGSRAASITVGNDGSITGVQDYKDLHGARVAEPITSGQCTSQGANRVHLQMISPSGETDFNAGMEISLLEGRIIEADGTSVYGVGKLIQQASAVPLAALAGDYTLGLVGSDSTGHRRGFIGRLTLDAAGNVSAGEVDANGPAPLTAAALTGHFSAPDAVHGRGTATLTAAGETLTIAYYVVDTFAPHRLVLANVDSSTSSSRLAGYMSRQTGAGTFNATSLSATWVLEFAGSTGTAQPIPSTSLGQISVVNPSNASAALDIDTVDQATPVVRGTGTGTYTVAPNGRATYVVPLTVGGTRSFVFYLGALASTATPATGFVIETSGSEAGFGFIDQQPAGFLATFVGGSYLGATLVPGAVAPMAMLPTQSMNAGTFSGNINGSYALDPVTGRGIALVSQDLLGGIGTVFYVVSANHVVMMGNGVNAVSSAIVMLDY